MKKIYLYDSTLRDGSQTQGVDFSVVDKQEISLHLDSLGIDYIEGGFSGANPTDDAFFANIPDLKKSRMVAFGMTRRPNTEAKNDKGLKSLIDSNVKSLCIVGKSSDFHVKHALGISLTENIAMISDSVAFLKENCEEVLFDAEHFFDGYKVNREYAIETIEKAYNTGARWIVLCDTNGGTLPFEIEEIVRDVASYINPENLAIHCHNDTENAVANAIAAVRAGVHQVQGTIGGYGERCGNTNLISIIPTLKLKMGYDVGISDEAMENLAKISHSLDDRLNRNRYRHAAYVGSSAFAHKGGLHVSAVLKNPNAYEHISPEKVGNKRALLVSDQAGMSNILNRLKEIGIETHGKEKEIKALIEEVKMLENQGYAYDGADASFELLAKRFLTDVPEFYKLHSFRVMDERRWNAKGELITFSEAKVKLTINGVEKMEVEEGNGPVNALNKALKKALCAEYSKLEDVRLIDYNVRIISPEKATEAVTRVQIESSDNGGNRWITVGVSENIIDASYNALNDAFIYKLLG